MNMALVVNKSSPFLLYIQKNIRMLEFSVHLIHR